MLLCPVRNCRLALARLPQKLACEKGHQFDLARSGYANLLQPQDKRSKQPGDTPEAAAARRRLHDLGITAPLLEAIANLARPARHHSVLDAGCGEGFYLANLARRFESDAHGIDLSVPAIDLAARRYKNVEWIVANADRFIPYSDACFSLVLSITARRNAPEFSRVLKKEGKLLVAIPAEDDLMEVRGRGRDRVESTVAAFSGAFELLERRRASTVAQLDASSVRDVQVSIYRPLQAEPPQPSPVTFSLDLLLFRKRA